MPLAEFALIDRFFAAHARRRADVALGIGDDAAVVNVPSGQQLVVAADTLVVGVHFPVDATPASIGHKALAVNLSDLAAMGAQPAWATLALTLPEADSAWVEDFAEGFFALADRAGVELVGGDTTRGPLTVTVQIMGLVPEGQALPRSGARTGDRIFVSGSLGDAGLALQLLQRGVPPEVQLRGYLEQRLHKPEPRLLLGEHLRKLASAAIDISDGLLADLGHILTQSGVGATLRMDWLPRSEAFRTLISENTSDWFDLPLSAGDDYELCFTVSPDRVAELLSHARVLGLSVTEIGEIEAQPGLRCRHADGSPFVPKRQGYEHFG